MVSTVLRPIILDLHNNFLLKNLIIPPNFSIHPSLMKQLKTHLPQPSIVRIFVHTRVPVLLDIKA